MLGEVVVEGVVVGVVGVVVVVVVVAVGSRPLLVSTVVCREAAAPGWKVTLCLSTKRLISSPSSSTAFSSELSTFSDRSSLRYGAQSSYGGLSSNAFSLMLMQHHMLKRTHHVTWT